MIDFRQRSHHGPFQSEYAIPDLLYLITLTLILIVNPFSKRESHSSSAVITYKVLTAITWLLSVIVSIHYSVVSPADELKYGRTIQGQNALHPSGFTLNFVLVDVYLCVPCSPSSY